MEVEGGHATPLVAHEGGVRRRMRLRKLGWEDEHQRRRAMLRLADGEVVVPNAMGAMVREEEERGVAPQQRLDRKEERAERGVKRAEARHEVLVRGHEVEQAEARRLARRVPAIYGGGRSGVSAAVQWLWANVK